MAFVRVLIGAAALAAVLCAFAPASAETTGAISLEPGRNAVIWNGAEPYPIAAFADTPVAQVHRWDAVRQEWLSHFVGRDGASLPELHLLPRVQYLLVAEATYELDVPDPIAEIDPLAELRQAAPPDDPLRFEAWWPNEDSPLEDLILLRSDDERLSVKAEVAGGVGEIEVYWILDGRLNHQGLESDDVELLPGKHDDAMLYAVGGAGQVVAESLPRVVKLPQVAIPEMVYGVNEWALAHGWEYSYTSETEIRVVAEAIAELGATHVRFDIYMGQVVNSVFKPGSGIEHLNLVFETLRDADLHPLPILGQGIPSWAFRTDFDAGCWTGAMRDFRHAEELARATMRLWPSITFVNVQNESNFRHNCDIDPFLEVQLQKAIALGVWYEQPGVIIVGAPLGVDGRKPFASGLTSDHSADGLTFIEAMYQFGYGPWHDVVALNYTDEQTLNELRAILQRYGDGEKTVWVTEFGFPWPQEPIDDQQMADHLVRYLQIYTERDDVSGAFVWKFRDTPDHLYEGHFEHQSGVIGPEYSGGRFTLQGSYHAVRDWLRALREKQAAGD